MPLSAPVERRDVPVTLLDPPTVVTVAHHELTYGPVTVSDSTLTIAFRVAGPEASVKFPKEHRVILRADDDEKLEGRDGWGGVSDDGSAFFNWSLDWPGGDGIRILCFEDGDQVVHDATIRM
jgi:hypothetical protein